MIFQFFKSYFILKKKTNKSSSCKPVDSQENLYKTKLVR